MFSYYCRAPFMSGKKYSYGMITTTIVFKVIEPFPDNLFARNHDIAIYKIRIDFIK